MELAEYLNKLESGLMLGSGRWIADFNEAFRDYTLDGLTFDLALVGSMRNRGFFISRFLSWIFVPNYYAACFVYSKDPELTRLSQLLRAIKNFMQQNEYAWSWLVIPHKGGVSRKVRSIVENQQLREVGIALVDLESREVVNSKGWAGSRMSRFIKTFR